MRRTFSKISQGAVLSALLMLIIACTSRRNAIAHCDTFDFQLLGLVVLFPFGVLTLLVGRQEWLPACKMLGVGLLVVTI